MPAPESGAGPGPSPRLYRRLLWSIYALAVLLRAWRFLSAPLTEENAIMGLMAQDLWAGRYPLFFYGQNWMGGLDSLLSAPLLALFGPTSWVLNLWPPLFGLAMMLVLHRLLVRLLKPAGVLCGLAFLALPPANWLFWSGYAQSHISLGVLWCALLLLVTWQLYERPVWGLGRPFLWGLLAGLAVYTLPQAGVVALPCGLLLVIWRARSVLGRPLPAAMAGMLLGAGPLIYYNLSQGWPHLGQAGAFGGHYLSQHLWPLLTNALPIALGFNTPPVLAGPGGNPLLWLYPLVLALSLLGLAGLAWRGRLAPDRPALLAPALVAVNLAALLFTGYGRALGSFHQAYLVPLYVALPLAWGLLGQWLAQRSRHLAWLMMLGLAGLHLAAYPGFVMHGSRLLTQPGATLRNEAGYQQTVAELRAAGFSHVYASPSYIWSFFGQGRPLVSEPWNERAAGRSFQVDASPSPAFWLKLGPSLDWLGLEYQRRDLAGTPIFYDFAPPQGVERLLPRQAWRAATLEGQDLGRSLSDGDLESGFNTVEPARPGQGFVLDLGREQPVAGLALVPGQFDETPAGIRLEWAGADSRFQPLAQVEKYWGPLYLSGSHPVLKARHPRVECYFAPRPARYLRLTHLGHSSRPWSVQEVLAWGPREPGQPAGEEPSWPESGRLLLEFLAQAPPRRVLADTWPAALIQEAFAGRLATTPGNTSWDDYGAAPGPPEQPLPLSPGPGQALVVASREADAVAASLNALGAPHERQSAGRLTLFRLSGPLAGRPLAIAGLSASLDAPAASALAQGLPAGRRWASQAPQQPGPWLLADLGQVQTLAWLELAYPDFPQDFARGLKAEVSADGQVFREVELQLAGPLYFSGQVLLSAPWGQARYHLPSRPQARYLRLSLSASHPQRWWSVQRLRLWGP